MWNRLSRHLWIAAVAVVLSVPAGVNGQEPAPGNQPQYKDPGEFTLYDSILKDSNPKTKLDKLKEWQTKYAATEFAKQRKALFLDTYVKLNQPAEAVAAAKEILAENPKDFTSLYYTMYFTRTLAGNNPTPDVLDQGEKAASAIVANIDAPPPNVTAEQWKGARSGVEALGHSTLGWIAMQRKNWEAAEGEFRKTLTLDPNNAEVDYFMGTVDASEKKMPNALFYFARAAAYEGPGALAPSGRQQALDYVKRAYKGYHGSDEGFNELLTAAKSQPAPAPDFRIRTAAEIAEDLRKKQEEDDAKNPQLKLWKDLKSQLTGAEGANYFNTGVKDAQLPTLKGKVVKLEPEVKPKTVLLALEDGITPDATLKFEMPLAGKVEAGTELSFEGVPVSYTASPYMVVFNVEADKLHGWTGKNAAPARSAPRRRAPGK
jgi:tetratricopeptide (TPR) repeat protein